MIFIEPIVTKKDFSLYMKHTFVKFFFFLYATTWTIVSYAGGFTINDISARGQSMQAYTAVADDPSAVFYNPAGLTQIEGTELQGNLLYLSMDQIYKNSLTRSISHSYPTILAPTFFMSTDRFEKFNFGFGIYAPFARKADYEKNSAVYFFNQKSSIARTDFSAVVSFKLNQYVSLGFGPIASRLLAYTDILGFHEKGDGIGFTAQGGALVTLPKNLRIGLTIRGHEFIQLDGRGKLLNGMRDKFSAGVNFPAIYSLGISWLTLDKLLLSGNIEFEQWDTLKTLKRKYKNPIFQAIGTTILNSRNVFTYRVGARYNITPKNQVTAGITFITATVPSRYIAPALPDYNGTNSSFGFTHYYSDKIRADFAYIYIHGPDRKSKSPVFPGSYSVKGNVFILGINYKV